MNEQEKLRLIIRELIKESFNQEEQLDEGLKDAIFGLSLGLLTMFLNKPESLKAQISNDKLQNNPKKAPLL